MRKTRRFYTWLPQRVELQTFDLEFNTLSTPPRLPYDYQNEETIPVLQQAGLCNTSCHSPLSLLFYIDIELFLVGSCHYTVSTRDNSLSSYLRQLIHCTLSARSEVHCTVHNEWNIFCSFMTTLRPVEECWLNLLTDWSTIDPNQSHDFHPAVLLSWLVLIAEFTMKWWSMFQISARKPYYLQSSTACIFQWLSLSKTTAICGSRTNVFCRQHCISYGSKESFCQPKIGEQVEKWQGMRWVYLTMDEGDIEQDWWWFTER